MATTHHDVSAHVHERVAELMLGGYSIDFACEKGVSGGWTRADVLEVVRARGWQLDPSGRIPFRERPSQPRGAARQQRRRNDRPVPAAGPEAAASVALDGETQVIGGVVPVEVPTAQDIREQVDEITPRTHEDGSVNAQHVALEQTLRERHGHPGYIAELDGPGKFRPDDDAGVRAAAGRILDELDDQLQLEAAGDACRVCGCTDAAACPGGCWWVAPALCSSCEHVDHRPEPVDVLAVGLAHRDARVRAAARAVEGAIDVLCAALTKAGWRA